MIPIPDIRPTSATVCFVAAGVFSIVVVAFGFIGLFAPATMMPAADTVTPGVTFFGMLIGARNIPLGVAALVVILRRNRLDPTPVLALSAVVQLGDTVIGLGHGLLGMGVSAAVGMVVYALCAGHGAMVRRGTASRTTLGERPAP